MGLGKREELNTQVYSLKETQSESIVVNQRGGITRSSNYWHNSIDFILSFRLGPGGPQSG